MFRMKITGVLATVLLAATAVQASTIVVPVSNTGTFSGNFQGFNPSLGTLQSVFFNLTYTVVSDITNNGTGTEGYHLADSFNVTFQSPNAAENLLTLNGSGTLSGSLGPGASLSPAFS